MSEVINSNQQQQTNAIASDVQLINNKINNEKNSTSNDMGQVITVNGNNNKVTTSTKLRRAFSMSKNPFRITIKRSNTIKNDTILNKSNDSAIMEDNKNNLIGNNKRVFRRSSWKKFLTRIAQQMTSVNNIDAKQQDKQYQQQQQQKGILDRVPPINNQQQQQQHQQIFNNELEQIPGVIGLRNHGNTCFMNAVLQCLSHTDILAEYFVLDQYKVDLKRRNKLNSKKFGTKGELTEHLALVLKSLWLCKDSPEYSTNFKLIVDRYGTQFRSSTQHDAQEFLFWLLDKVHEDLNTATKKKYKIIKNNYGRSDEINAAETLANHIRCNNSFVQAVFQAQFRSSLSCPRCHKQSNTFDPFHCISVQLPQLLQQPVFVTVLYGTQHPRQVKLGIGVPPGSTILALREQLKADTGIPLERIILTEICINGFTRVFCDSHPITTINENDPIYCIETPEVISNKNEVTSKDTSAATATTKKITTDDNTIQLILCISNVKRNIDNNNMIERFGTPFCIIVNRDISYTELQKLLLKQMSSILKSELFTYVTSPKDMFKIYLQDPSVDPDTYLDHNVEHPLFTEIIDLALTVLPSDAGPQHIKLLLEWFNPDLYFNDISDQFVEHESVQQLKSKLLPEQQILTLEQCLEHYTKAETLSAEDAWRCPHCQKYLPVVKTLGLWSLPDILVIHFKRFRQQQLKGSLAAKLTTMVKFPLNGFDMTPHLARINVNSGAPNGGGTETPSSTPTTSANINLENWTTSTWRKIKRKDSNLLLLQQQQLEQQQQYRDNRYDLYAVCYHQGDTLETGHYTAACKNPYDNEWYKFDDQRVTHVSSSNITEEIVNNEAYILFYQRRKYDVNGECSTTTSSTNSYNEHWITRLTAKNLINTTNSAKKNSCTILNDEVKIDEEKKDEIIIDDVTESNNTNSNNDDDDNVKNNTTITITTNNVYTNNDNNDKNIMMPNLMSESSTENSLKTIDNNNIINNEANSIINNNIDDKEIILNNFDSNLNDNDLVINEIQESKSHMKTIVEVNNENNNDKEIKTPIKKEILKVKTPSPRPRKEKISEETLPTLVSSSLTNGRESPIFKPHLSSLTNVSLSAFNTKININFSDIITPSSSTTNCHLLTNNNNNNNHNLLASSLINNNNNNSNGNMTNGTTADTISMIRGASSCSKDTLMYIDQQVQHNLINHIDDTDDEDNDNNSIIGRSIWISPVTPHKLITVSPKN